MYQRKSRLSSHKQAELIKLFVAGSTARATAEIVGVNKNTASSFFMRLRAAHSIEISKLSTIWRSRS